MIDEIYNKLKDNQTFTINICIHEINYKIIFLPKDANEEIFINSLLIIPLNGNINNQILLEANNCEPEFEKDEDYRNKEIIKQAMETAKRLVSLTIENPSPICIPLISSPKDGVYLQQLSYEAMQISKGKENFRIDNQIINIIENVKKISKEITNITMQDRIFLNGYSSSGVFAQRFSLLHPEIVDSVCIGGASGSIPVIINDIEYPLGIGNFEQIFGKEFNTNEYLKIKFRYYVGELELERKAMDRNDENGNPAPMHDMSYFKRSVPKAVGQKQRELYGRNLFERAYKIISDLREKGVNISHTVIQGRGHNNIGDNIEGINEIGDRIFQKVFEANLNSNLEKGRSK